MIMDKLKPWHTLILGIAIGVVLCKKTSVGSMKIPLVG